jgi:hypothetical protein
VTKDDGSRWILKETGGAPGRGGGRAARHRPMNVVLEGATEGCARDGVGGRLHDDELRRWGRGRGRRPCQRRAPQGHGELLEQEAAVGSGTTT